jgi:protein-L-isoaspartate(D-aspartate) O-methyltransferase
MTRQGGNGKNDLAANGLMASKERLFRRLAHEVGDGRTIQAMAQVPREAFVPAESRHLAYGDIPLPIGYDQTISQPHIVAIMTAALALKPRDKVLEIGTGSGYQAAVLAELASLVITVERLPQLCSAAQARLDSLGYWDRVGVRMAGDGLGCPEEAPFDAIIVTAGAPKLPAILLDQLAPGGRLVVPVGSREEQNLFRAVRNEERFTIQTLGPCRFVPLVGRDAWQLLPEGSETA